MIGVSCGDYRRAGAFAEFVVVPQRIAYQLPDALEFPQAAMLEAVSVALHAVRVSEMKGGETTLVIGAGMIGLLTLQAAKAGGAARVLVADIDQTRLQRATSVGADETLLLSGGELVKEVLRRTAAGAWTWCSKRSGEKKPLPPRSRVFARVERLPSSATFLPRSRSRYRLWSHGRFVCRDHALPRANIPRQWNCWPAGKSRCSP